MYVTFLFIILISGLIIAEHNTRNIIYGYDSSFFQYDIESKEKFIKFIFMGKHFSIYF